MAYRLHWCDVAVSGNAAYLRTGNCKKTSSRPFYNGIKHKPETTFGNVKADVPADKDPSFRRMNFCTIRGSQWRAKKSLRGVLWDHL